MTRRFSWPAVLCSALVALALAACGPARTSQTPDDPRLSALFAELKDAQTPLAAHLVEQKIIAVWTESGSPSIDVLVERAGAAAARGDDELARHFIEEATRLKPEYVEAWRMRASLAIAAEDYETAMEGILETLRREPRHFNALVQLGALYEGFGERRAALEAYRMALAVHPHLDPARQGEQRLAPLVDGRAT
jgi:tetratricopeptide (TPR) repeat protein